jgi:hypothetical protein
MFLSVEDLIRDVTGFFSNSSLRRKELEAVQVCSVPQG